MPGISLSKIGIPFRRGGGAVAPDGAPTGLSLTVISDTVIQLDWTDNSSNEDGFRIYISTDGVLFTEKGTVAADVETYNATGLTAGNTYYFYVTAYKGETESDPTDTESKSISTLLSNLIFSLKWDGSQFINAVTGLAMVDHGSVAAGTPIVTNSAIPGTFVIASSKYLSTPDTPALSMGDIDFMVAIWFNLPDVTTTQTLAGHWASAGDQKSWAIIIVASKVRLYYSNNGSTSIYSQDTTNLSINTDYLLFAWHDSTNDAVYTQINMGSIVGKSHATGIFNSSADLSVGALGDPSSYVGGLVGNVDVWKRKLSDVEKSAYWASGLGNKYPFNGAMDTVEYLVAKCWFTRDTAIYSAAANKTWIGLIHNDGDGYTQHIITFDNLSNQSSIVKIGSVISSDDHNEPSILIRSSDNKLFTAYTEHQLNHNIKYRISKNALDATEWEEEQAYVAYGTVSYCSCVQSASGNIYIFYRSGSNWFYIKSIDGGATFGSEMIFYDGFGSRGYLIIAQSPIDSNIIYILFSSNHPEEAANCSCYSCYMDLSEDKFYKLNGTETTSNKPFNEASDLTAIMENANPDVGWIEDIMVDSNGYPRFLMTFYPNGENTNYLTKELYYAEWDGLAVTTPHKIHTALVGSIALSTVDGRGDSYPPCACFNRNNIDEIIASKQTDGVCEIYKITRVAADNFTSEQLTENSNHDQIRPFSVNNNSNNVFWFNKDYYYDYTLFTQSLKIMTV